MLLDILRERKCFKLVCGAGNEDETEVEKLVTLYSKAGCNFFDICAKPEIVKAAKKGLERAGIKENRYLCVSCGIKGDPHVSKAYINADNCVKCGKCTKTCLQYAIAENPDSYKIKKTRCIGCGKCSAICPQNAITMTSEFKNLQEVLPPIISLGIDCIELHAIGYDENEIDNKWNDMNSLFDGILSICIDRSKLSDESALARVKRLMGKRSPYTTIIQADGAPMSGGEDDYKTTLQTVAMAEIFQNAKLPAYILLSGGTNSKTTELASMCDIKAAGVAVGSYARQIVRKYIDRPDFLTNETVFNEALAIAKNLVDTSFRNLK